jgi:type VI secretion system FHA domain protein
MGLLLEVVGARAQQLGSAARKELPAGGTIGRLRDNDLVLPDSYISGHHAKISFVNGSYVLVDTSTNGLGVNSPASRLARGQQHVLRDGDRLFIEDYEIRVRLTREPVMVAPPPIPFDPFTEDPGQSVVEGETDPINALGLAKPRAPVASAPRAADLEAGSFLNQHYQPPSSVAAPSPPKPQASLIPDDYDPLAADEPAPSPASSGRNSIRPGSMESAVESAHAAPPTPALAARAPVKAATRPDARPAPSPAPSAAAPARRPTPGVAANPAQPAVSAAAYEQAPRLPPAPSRVPSAPAVQRAELMPMAPASAATNELDFAALMAAAGLNDVPASPELARNFGQVLRVVITGLMDVLRTRERIKDEFRMRMTSFKTKDNNPLKFSANVEDALHNLLVKRNAAYLGPVEAFEDAFADLRNHQMAMLEGIRVAYEAMLKEFDPDQLQQQFEKKIKRGSILGGPGKAKFWELYRDQFHAMVKDADSSFRSLFGDEFATAYEAQLERLKTLDRANRR